jgi:putative hydrolase of the HAD superfamily
MVDFPSVPGKMCDWEVVEAVNGAKEVLEALSKHSQIYVATGAADSTELEIKRAFERVGLNQFISGYFCKANKIDHTQIIGLSS